MCKLLTPKEQGSAAWKEFRDSVNYRHLSKDARAEDVMKLFLPPEDEQLLQVSRPLSKQRRDWIAGFNEARLAEGEKKC